MLLSELQPGQEYDVTVHLLLGGVEVATKSTSFSTSSPVVALGSVSLTSPAEGASLKSPVSFSASVIGAADSVSFAIFNSVGAKVKDAAGTSGGAVGVWTVGGVVLDPGSYTVKAVAVGKDANSAAITKESAVVGFLIPAPPECGPEAPATVCTNGLVCKSGKCVSCSADAECGTGQVCSAGKCAAPPPPPPECGAGAVSAECTNGLVCKSGKCAACSAAAECGAGQVCSAGKCAVSPVEPEQPPSPEGTGTPPGNGTDVNQPDGTPTGENPTGAVEPAPGADAGASEGGSDEPSTDASGAPAGGGGTGGQENPPALDSLCVANSIGPKGCAAWLEIRYADRTCAAAGIMTKESCERFLTDGNGGTFPGCEGATADECQRIKDLTTLGYMPSEAKAEADAAIDQDQDSGVVPAVPGLTSVSGDAADSAAWYPSSTGEGQETSSLVVIIDSDRDGLPDDMERILGTDPLKADTDGDGVSDRDELKNGTDPLDPNNGQPPKPLDATTQAIVDGMPLGQPRGSGQTDAAMDVHECRADEVPGGQVSGVMLCGRCQPNTTCLIYTYSYVPMVLTTVADANGNFSYNLGDSISDGGHTVYVALTDDQGQVTQKSNPLSLFVRAAQAVTAADFVREDVVTTAEPMARMEWTYLLGVIGLVVVSAVAALLVMPRMRRMKNPD